MAMVSVVYWQPTGGLMDQADRLNPKSRCRQPPGAVLHSSHEPGELSECFKHDDSTTKIIVALGLLLLLLLHLRRSKNLQHL